MSPSTAEMRKRVWATIVELDLGISTQLVLHRLIKHWQTDTGGPSNLHDNDFDRATANMPASRPENGLTHMLYRLVKARMMATIGFVWDLATDTRQYPYTEIMKMDSMLRDAHSTIPSCLQWRSMVHCIVDSPQMIMQKVFLEIMFHRAQIVLHQRNLHSWQADTQHDYSQKACLDAALKLLDYQHVLQEETQPFCRLYQERWRVSFLVNHDFLLATSILCSYLHQARAQNKGYEGAVIGATIWTSLQKIYDIWLRSSRSSKEAQRVLKALRNPARFNIQFPDFDATALADWSPSNDGIESFPITTPASSVDWQMIDTAINAMQSPGGESSQFPDGAGR
ncbi:fungal specific transcription factor domain-containing protein [Aspergillus thermomutatus]|uniref:Transcription factor domain-containing protein n=1 Tax=Aspergillus thermomutatus TaxID=41047 RepID=A0A397GT78_ASPTH|nr:uncharacterized protein CDV56_106418 [Aspergillus thermomutatus]RHZ54025.1 hypothetical protein CDV56_106418 [Aspergillus thermomutatus]